MVSAEDGGEHRRPAFLHLQGVGSWVVAFSSDKALIQICLQTLRCSHMACWVWVRCRSQQYTKRDPDSSQESLVHHSVKEPQIKVHTLVKCVDLNKSRTTHRQFCLRALDDRTHLQGYLGYERSSSRASRSVFS